MPGTVAIWVGNTYSQMSGTILCNTSAHNTNSLGSIEDNLAINLSDVMNYLEH